MTLGWQINNLTSQEMVAQPTSNVTNYLFWARHLTRSFYSDLSLRDFMIP